MNRYVQQGDNPDITEERLKATFDVDRFTEFYHGGLKRLKSRRKVERYLEEHAELRDIRPTPFMSRDELIDNSIRKLAGMAKFNEMIDLNDIEKTTYFLQMVHVRDSMPFSLHYLMFLPVLNSQASPEQLATWMPLALSGTVIGTYAQTEMGHGTNLSKLETTATYDPNTQEFILHTPTISGAKWWPGSLGKFCNHAIIVANLWTQGKCEGPHPFWVQIRDSETHEALKNVRLGDIGPKLSLNGSDNGYLIFDNFRIPRENMLMRHSKVLPDGTYVKPPHSKLAYGGMVFVRSMMVRDIANHLANAVTIATRYSAVRRQGEPVPGKGEVKILDYQTQQYRIFPYIAKAIAFRIAGEELQEVSKQLKKGEASQLPDIHALSSGLKALVTFEVQQGIEQCRLACGGHGYSHASGIPELSAFSCGSCTYEGDNLVLMLQVAKYLTKAVTSPVASGICAYLHKKSSALQSALSSHKTYSDLQIVQDFEHVTRRAVLQAMDKLKIASGTMPDAWNRCSVELSKAARWHIRLYIVRIVLSKISTAPEDLKPVLRTLAKLYIFDLQVSNKGHFMEEGYMSAQQIDELKEGIWDAMSTIRPDAVSIVDAFAIHEIELKSVLGRRDGNVYPGLMEWTKHSQLNEKDVPVAFDKYLAPIIKKLRSRL
uniref:Acyl-coenzyme A oxidase n=1 Tax=Caenorhabditis tropicalis TaxID=1561998 RepID=A0A1I7TUV3_9PELO